MVRGNSALFHHPFVRLPVVLRISDNVMMTKKFKIQTLCVLKRQPLKKIIFYFFLINLFFFLENQAQSPMELNPTI